LRPEVVEDQLAVLAEGTGDLLHGFNDERAPKSEMATNRQLGLLRVADDMPELDVHLHTGYSQRTAGE
jgi:hypothetical protein